MDVFFKSISEAKSKPAILKIVEPYSESFVPQASLPCFPKPISELYDPETLKLPYNDLLKRCKETYNLVQVM